MSPTQAREVRERVGLALVLAGVGGFVDAVGYVVLFHLFTAHMSGNTAALGVAVGQSDWRSAFHHAFPIPVFVSGVAVGAAVAESLARRRVRAVFAPLFAAESLLLVLFMACGAGDVQGDAVRAGAGWSFYLPAALPALAMGVQNATLRRAGGTSVRTTFVTGMLTDLTEEAVRYLFWVRDNLGRGQRLTTLLRLSPRQPDFKSLLLHLGIWLCYVLGAVLGAVAQLRWGLLSLALPVACLLLAALCDLAWPLAPQTRGPIENEPLPHR